MLKTNLKLSLVAATFIAACVFLNIMLEEGFNGAILLVAFAFSVGSDIVIATTLFLGLTVHSCIEPFWQDAVRRNPDQNAK